MRGIEKAKILLDKLRTRTVARGATAAEAQQAAELAEKIIARYGLHETKTEDCLESVSCGFKKIPIWWIIVGHAIARRFGVKSRFRDRDRAASFFGPPHLASVAAWLFRAIKDDIDKNSYQSAKEAGFSGGKLRSFRVAFSLSAACRVSDRIEPIPIKDIVVTKADEERWEKQRLRRQRNKQRRLASMTIDQRREIQKKNDLKKLSREIGSKFGNEIPIETNAVGGVEVNRLTHVV